LALRMDARFGTCTQSCSAENDQFITRFQLRSSTGNFESRDYAAYRESMAQALTGLERNVSFTEKAATK